MRIGELAKSAGVTPDTVRFYEREGLLVPPPRTPSGYRDYGTAALEDLTFIKKAQTLGLKLADVHDVLEISSGGKPPCEHVRATISLRLAEVEMRLRELRSLRTTLRETLERIDSAPPASVGCRCTVIEGVGLTPSR